MTAYDIKSYLGYLNKLVDQSNNTFHGSIGKKSVDAGYSVLTEKTESSNKAPKFKVDDRVSDTKYNISFSKGYSKHFSREIFIIDCMLKETTHGYIK